MRFSWLAGALALGACATDVPVDQFLSRYEAAACNLEVACEAVPDVPTCETSYIFTNLALQTLVYDVGVGLVKYDAAQAGLCIAYVSNACVFAGEQDLDSACTTVFTGEIAVNQPCSFAKECASGACQYAMMGCNSSTTCCLGTCVAAPAPVALGGPCAASADCVAGAYCAGASAGVSGTCTTIATSPGAPCDTIDGCANPMICNLVVGATATCTTPAATGFACDTTQLLPCADPRDYCDSSTSTCTPRVGTAAACDVAPNLAQCVGYDACTGNLCTPRPAAGQPCSVVNGVSDCLGELQCLSGMCVLGGGVGSGSACM